VLAGDSVGQSPQGHYCARGQNTEDNDLLHVLRLQDRGIVSCLAASIVRSLRSGDLAAMMTFTSRLAGMHCQRHRGKRKREQTAQQHKRRDFKKGIHRKVLEPKATAQTLILRSRDLYPQLLRKPVANLRRKLVVYPACPQLSHINHRRGCWGRNSDDEPKQR
jgi:hypothetical protein